MIELRARDIWYLIVRQEGTLRVEKQFSKFLEKNNISIQSENTIVVLDRKIYERLKKPKLKLKLILGKGEKNENTRNKNSSSKTRGVVKFYSQAM